MTVDNLAQAIIKMRHSCLFPLIMFSCFQKIIGDIMFKFIRILMYHYNLRPSIKSMKICHWYFIENVDLNLKSMLWRYKNQLFIFLLVNWRFSVESIIFVLIICVPVCLSCCFLTMHPVLSFLFLNSTFSPPFELLAA